MSKIVNLSRFIGEKIEIEPFSINIYKIIYEVEELNISNITLNIYLIDNQKKLINLEIQFKNVINFSLQDLSGIISIDDFEILDHKEDGWSTKNRFEVHDLENEKIHFVCQAFKVKQLQK